MGSTPRAPCHPLAGTDLQPVWGVLFPAVMSQFFGVLYAVRVTLNNLPPLRPVYVPAPLFLLYITCPFPRYRLPSAPVPCLSVAEDTEKVRRKEALLSLRAPCILPKQKNVYPSRSFMYRNTRQRMKEQDFFFVLYPLLLLRLKNSIKII